MKLFALFIAIFIVAHSYAQPCPEGEVLCKETEDECIPEEYVCDGKYLDCSNGADEEGCPCPPDQFTCPNSNLCIPNSWICDTDRDCPGGEDEKGCQSCPGFICNDGTCIPGSRECDGYQNCPDNEDEKDCPGCTGFSCSDGKCIPKDWACDREWDCSNDEANCNCYPSDSRCDDGLCIPDYWDCDGSEDCRDGSDETNCTVLALPAIPAKNRPLPNPQKLRMTTTFAKLPKSKIKRNQKKSQAAKRQLSCLRSSGRMTRKH